jgi:HEAT repeat protein
MLAGLRQHDPRVLTILLDRLQFDAADGAFCLGLYGDPAARPALEKMLGEIEESDTDLKREVQFALEQLDAPEPEYTPEPIDILEEYPERDTPALDMLSEAERVEMLGSTDAETRAAAAHTFFNQDLDPKETAALLNLAKNDSDVKVRARAWASLADQTSDETDGSRIREAMLAVANDASRDAMERGGAAVGLYGVADRKDVQPVIEALYEEGGYVRAKAMESMWRSLWKPFAKYFAPHLDDKDINVLRQAIRGVGYFRLTAHAGRIAEFFEADEAIYGSKAEDLREDALFAYALAMPGETTRGRMKGMLRKIDELAQLNPHETDLVMFALDERLALNGLDPVFAKEHEHDHEHDHEGHDHDHHDHGHSHEGHDHGHATMSVGPSVNAVANGAAPKVGRNDACPCGSGKKYKKCHGA